MDTQVLNPIRIGFEWRCPLQAVLAEGQTIKAVCRYVENGPIIWTATTNNEYPFPGEVTIVATGIQTIMTDVPANAEYVAVRVEILLVASGSETPTGQVLIVPAAKAATRT
jgi:hypothetical protein